MNRDYFTKNNEKDLKRRSEIQKITKTTIRKPRNRRTSSHSQSKLRMSTGAIGRSEMGIEVSQQEPDDDPDEFMTAYEEEMKSNPPGESIDKSNSDSQSFKSFAMDNDGGSVASSIHESQFGDAIDEVDYWRLNHDQQHFSLVPILTINSFKNIGKSIRSRYDTVKLSSSLRSSKEDKGNSGLLDSVEHQEDINFHFPHHFIDPENLLVESEDDSEEEKEVRLGDLKPHLDREIDNSIEVTIDVQKHLLEKSKKTVSLIDVDIKTQNIFIELTP